MVAPAAGEFWGVGGGPGGGGGGRWMEWLKQTPSAGLRHPLSNHCHN